jgi:surface protein
MVPYIAGNKKTFWEFTSTSSNPKMTYNFLKEEEKIKTGTIFSIGGHIWGYDIELFNYFGEKEILLEPERKFIIDNVLPPQNEIINVTCIILKTPLILSNNETDQDIIAKNEINYNGNNDDNINYLDINKYITKIETEIKINENLKYISGIGLLCNIPIKYIKVLITYNHIINFELLNEMKKLRILINNKEIEIDMQINRYKYTNNELDITIIEILDEDNISDFIDIDKFINSRNYENEDIISVYLKDNKKIDILNGKIKSKNKDNYICSLEEIIEGIIILKDNQKLIGIIKENNDHNIIEFIPMNIIINKINFIKCKYEINKDDLGKDIQIINNKDYNDKIRNNEMEKEIKVIINGEIKSNILKYKFNKEGIYVIYLITYNLLTNMSGMFNDCFSLKELNLSSFNTNQVTNISKMFYNCSSLEKLNNYCTIFLTKIY